VNAETGIHFRFDYCQERSDEWATGEYVAFRMNYFRPHISGLEAEIELSAFVNAFACAIHDPQLDGMGDGPYSASGFLRGWNTGNAFAYEAGLFNAVW
jgi:hypothetical protein